MQDMLARFRQEVRHWLEVNCPPAMRVPAASDDELYWGGRNAIFASQDQRLWFERMVAKGWTAPTWPTQYGGAALSAEQADILRQELTLMGCRQPLAGWGLTLLGPTLLRYASDELKAKYLPAISQGKLRWCQGFSEPNAGSDLAALTTAADPVDGGFLVNGQKIWTTYGDRSDMMFCPVRTDKTLPKREGISFLLLDMTSKGVTPRTIKLISGTAEFCEVFFEDVFVPAENLVGELNRGWEVTKYLLGCEREVSGRVKGQGATSLGNAYRAQGRAVSPVERQALARFDLEAWGFSSLLAESAHLAGIGIERPGLGSAIKYIGSELNKTRLELQMSLSGSDGLAWEGLEAEDGLLASTWLRTKANSIAGGSNEMQFNMTARQVLGLPTRPANRTGEAAAIDFDEDLRQVRQAVRGMLDAAAPTANVRALREGDERFSGALWRQLADNGFTAVMASKEKGGLALGASVAAIIAEELGRAMIRQPFLSHAVVGMVGVMQSGNARLQERLLGSMADGTQRVTLALEESAKHDPFARVTRAEPDGEGYVLNGAKRFVPDANAAQQLIVLASLPSGDPILALVPAADHGVTLKQRHLIDEGDWADIDFADVTVPSEAILARGEEAQALLDGMLEAGRLVAAAELLGLGDEACDRTVAFLKTRRQFDNLLSEYQALQHRVAQVHMRLELARAAVHSAARKKDETGRAHELAAAAKFLAGEAATLAVQEAVQLHGGIAMTDAADIGFLVKRARVLCELYGDAEFQTDLFAKQLGY